MPTATPTPAATSTSAPTPSPIPTPAPPTAPSGAPDIQISCISFDGEVPRTESDESVEIANLGDAPQELAGWKLADIDDGTPSFTFPPGVLEPAGVIRVYTNEVHPEWGGFSFARGTAIWSNSEPDEAGLFDELGTLVSTRTYPPGC